LVSEEEKDHQEKANGWHYSWKDQPQRKQNYLLGLEIAKIESKIINKR